MAEATPLTFSGKVKDTFLGKIEDCVVAPIRRQFTYMFCFDNNIKKLEAELEELQTTRELVQRGVNEGRRQVRDTGLNVKAWLNTNEVTSNQVEGIIQDKAKVKEGCLNGWCPNLKLRYSLSRKAVKNTKVVVDLEAAGFDYVITAYSLPHVENFKALKSDRRLNMEEILKALKHDQIDLIGICGMAGVGKTTMAREVAERAKGNKLFDEVAMAMVGEIPNLSKIQASIADVLGLELGDMESPIVGAPLLHQRLLQDNKKILVILDDIRVELALDTIGIPLRGANKNVKILYTSRTRDLWHDLPTKKEITLATLSEDEAWQLFRENAGDLADAPDLRPIAKQIVNKCGGLPLALVLVGSTFSKRGRGNFITDFLEDMLDRLSCTSNTPAHGHLSSFLELSYNYVEDEEGKRLFLLCCSFEEDKSILLEDLARYTLGLSLLDGISEMRKARDRVFALVDDLKSRYLLLDGENDKCVKVHDIVRDMGLSIASKGKGALVWHGEVSEWPNKGTYEHCISISVISKKITGLPERLTCPNLEFLLLECKKVEKLPCNFFEGMEKLKVLELINYDGILTLQSLRNLRTLSLQRFGGMLDNVSAIGDLLNLEILSFQGSSIDELPEEIGELVNLRLLDLDNTWSLNRILPGVISRLVHLEELYIFHSKFRDWEGEGNEEGRNANLRELSSSNLNTLEISITCDVLIPKIPIFSKLTTYKLLIGDKGGHNRCIDQYKRQLIVTAWTTIPSDFGGIDSLLGSSDCLILLGKGCNDLVRELLLRDGVNGIQRLKHLEIHDCDTPEYLANTMYVVQLPAAPTPVVFPILEELKLSMLPNLREICRGPVPAGLFGKLTEIDVDNCGRLGNLFQLPVVGSLTQLKSLSIKGCDRMEEVFGMEQREDVHDATNKIEFPKLEYFSLVSLPRLMGFCRGIDQIDFPQLKVMRLQDLGQLNHLIHKNSNMSSNSEQASDIGFLALFPPKVTFHSLELLELKGLKNLDDVWGSELSAFSFFKLKELEVEDCGSLRDMFHFSMAGGLVNLQKLIIRNCLEMEVVVGREEEIEDGQGREIEKTLFPQLIELELCHLPRLRRFCDSTDPIDDQLSQLSKIHISDCPRMDAFYLKELRNSSSPWFLLVDSKGKGIMQSKSSDNRHGAENRGLVVAGGGGTVAEVVPPTGRIITPNLRIFTYAELKRATRNFRPDSVLGEGRFGTVFKGWVDGETLVPSKPGVGMPIAVKKSNPVGLYGLKELQAAVEFLGKFSHPNLVKLLGYCWEDEQFLLILEYMGKGSLETLLFRKVGKPIPWDTRLNIATGAAQGLAFLHTMEKKVIYRDFKASKILLDEDFNAKLSDLGLATWGPADSDTHVTTSVIGTYGYADPEYIATGHLYVKSDVYSFGVVLLELLTGLRVVDVMQTKGAHNLTDWAKRSLVNKRKLTRIMDPRLENQYPPKAAFQAAVVVLKCLESDPRSRPPMEEVLVTLRHINSIKMNPKESKASKKYPARLPSPQP
ncbi:hypothetical protein RHMOL_Rhmol03G0047800 [Rhododendron molle]|uniref:Uncharacterized protein n=1 Tax=Rhododendron molle TaxID=49168 RepID=A0ACC0PBQ9_RHOML|nr:hypothetical protein RHMOL_Rhmol03G0047800 [Rhododendron molle]